MFAFLMAVELIICILLVVAVLMQASKGGGLAGTFGGGQVGMMFGVRRTADFLIKSTQILAGAFIVLALVINIFFLPRVTGSVESVIQSGSTAAPTPTVPQLPPTGAPAQQEVPSGSPTPSK